MAVADLWFRFMVQIAANFIGFQLKQKKIIMTSRWGFYYQ